MSVSKSRPSPIPEQVGPNQFSTPENNTKDIENVDSSNKIASSGINLNLAKLNISHKSDSDSGFDAKKLEYFPLCSKIHDLIALNKIDMDKRYNDVFCIC